MLKRLNFCLLLLMLALTASPAQAKSSGTTPGDSLFIEASVDNARPWVGQEILLTYTLFFRDVAPGIKDKTMPDHSGLWIEEVSPENFISSTPTSVNGTMLRKAVVKQLRLVPLQSGKLSVTSYRLGCFLPKDRQLTLDSKNDIETVVTAPAVVIEAKALPKPSPEGFIGAVGSFSVSVTPEKSQLSAGEPLTLFITVSGRGNLNALPPVALNLPPGLRKDESAVPSTRQNKAGVNEESVTTRITLTPEKIGTFRFVPVRLTLFDPLKARYETIAAREITVTVVPGKITAPQPRTYPVPEKPSRGILSTSSWIMLAMAAVVVSIILGLFALGRRKRAAGPVRAMEEPASPSPVQTGRLSAESLRCQLYDALKKAGVRNPGGLTSKELRKKLGERKVKEKTADAILELLAKIDQAIYAPGETSTEQLEALNRSALQIVVDLSRR
ncbi:MAG TPA: BatD family protein [Chlorobaculum sp.]|nr:BatD family protein [Chlorobaculum sp.]